MSHETIPAESSGRPRSFQCSLRNLMLSVLICGLALGWCVDRWNLKKQLSLRPQNVADVRIFTIVNGDAREVVTSMAELFGGGDNSPRIAVDARTNSLIARGRAADLSVVEAILLKLDSSKSYLEQKTNPKAKIRAEPTTAVLNPSIPKEAAAWEGNRYLLIHETMTPNAARRYCETLGGHLARIESEGEYLFVTKLLGGASIEQEHPYCWVDGSDEGVEGEWTYSNGTVIAYCKWAEGSPDGFPNEHSLCIDFRDMLFSDANTSWRCAFLCEWDSSTNGD